MNEKLINKWLRRQFSPLGWTLIVYYLMMNVLVAVSVLAEFLRANAGGRGFGGMDFQTVLDNGWSYITCVLVGLVILYAWKGEDFFQGMLISHGMKMRPGTFCALVVLCLGLQMVNSLWLLLLEFLMNLFGRSELELLEAVSGATNSVSMFLYASIVAPISEELLFRGLCLRTLEPFGKRFAIVCSAFLFGIFHGNLLQAPYAFLMGMVLGYTALEYSVWWAIGLHMFNNLVVADLLSRCMEHLSIEAGNMLSLLLFGGAAIASAVVLILRRGQIRDYHSQGMDRRCLQCFFTSAGVAVLTGIMLLSMIMNL